MFFAVFRMVQLTFLWAAEGVRPRRLSGSSISKVIRKRITMRGPMRGSCVDYEAVAKDIPGLAIEAMPKETERRISCRRTRGVSEPMSAAEATK